MLSPVRRSVRHTGRQSKTVEVRIMIFFPYGSPIALVLRGKCRPEILTGPPRRGVKQRRGGKTTCCIALNVNVSKKVGDTSKVTNRKLDMRFRLAQRSMTLDDLDLL